MYTYNSHNFLLRSSFAVLVLRIPPAFIAFIQRCKLPSFFALITIYGRPLSVSGRPCYVLPMFFIYLFIFLWPPYSPALVNGGSRKFYTWWTFCVIREVSTWIFFLVTLKLQGGPKSDEIWRIFRPHPQTFCSDARTRQNIVILKKTC